MKTGKMNALLLQCSLTAHTGLDAAIHNLLTRESENVLCCRDLIVLPMYHSGMAKVLPFKSKLFHAGQTVTVMIGEYKSLGSLLTCICAGRLEITQVQLPCSCIVAGC
jgi:hypothetical protein